MGKLIDADLLKMWLNMRENEDDDFITARSVKTFIDIQSEAVVRCSECKWFQCNMRQDGTLPKGVDEFECRHWCGYCDPMDFCSYWKRRTDETD